MGTTAPGTFLVRDSRDSRFIYSLSVQRAGLAGPTSVRIQFEGGRFSLDAEERIRSRMPQFPSVAALVQHYVAAGRRTEEREQLVDAEQEQAALQHSPAPILLRHPLYSGPPSLAHSARLAVNRALQPTANADMEKELTSLKLPPKLLEFLKSYQLSI